MGDEVHSEDAVRQRPHLTWGPCDLHSTPLSPSARVDLGLHHPDVSSEFARRRDGLLDGEGDTPPRNGDAELFQYFLASYNFV